MQPLKSTHPDDKPICLLQSVHHERPGRYWEPVDVPLCQFFQRANTAVFFLR
jgi:hypothetical protein